MTFCNLLTETQTVVNTYAQVARAQSTADLVQALRVLIAINTSCTTWYERTTRYCTFTFTFT